MKNLSAAVLCGGRSQRMGFDKALMLLRGDFLLGAIAAQLNPAFDDVMLITNEIDKLSGITSLKACSVYVDSKDGLGPICAIHTALKNAKNDRVFIMGCDMPIIDLAFIATMNSMVDYDVVLPRHGDLIEPLYAIYSKDCIDEFERCMNNGNLSIRSTFSNLRVKEVDASGNMDIFTNLNRPEDIAKVSTKIAVKDKANA